VIGCSLRQQDTRLWSLIDGLGEGVNVTLVNPISKELKEMILSRNDKLQILETYESFRAFAKTL
jgi:hypothetical protein